MVADDTLYNTPHETALAVVATAMKKARLQIPTLVINSIVGGVLFSSGSILTIAAHADNPGLWQSNPGVLSAYSSITYGIGLFYVVIMGADLFNSNILFFSVGVLRQAVTIYDLLISWFISLLGNLGGSLFVSYLFVHLSGISSSELWIAGSRKLVEDKASFSFIKTLLKGIAGNFYVCLAIYLQLMAKPLHVRLMVIVLPIFTFVSCGFTHAVADMTYCYIGMLNGGAVTVAEYIWKLLIPACVGNIIGGFSFSLVIPFYLHLVVVEQDRKRLSLPEYDARDEQPELNTDSRVVRISPQQERQDEQEAEETEEYDGEPSEKVDMDDSNSASSHLSREATRPRNLSSARTSQVALSDFQPQIYEANTEDYNPTLSEMHTLKSTCSRRSNPSSRRRSVIRSPPGVFPVRGMGEPLRKERTIENPNYALNQLPYRDGNETPRYNSNTTSRTVSRRGTDTPNTLENQSTYEKEANNDDEYTVLEEKPGAKLERALTKLVEHRSKTVGHLPRTTQDTFPYNKPGVLAYNEADAGHLWHNKENGLLKSLTKEFSHAESPHNAADLEKQLQDAGITHRAALAANSVAGVSNYNNLDLQRAHTSTFDGRQPLHSARSHARDSHPIRRMQTASVGTLLNGYNQPERRRTNAMTGLSDSASQSVNDSVNDSINESEASRD
ncbi:uncharacterized protein TDEL_0A03150 [Torulaspora delbrueckii]|uniref:Formate/nitrite transporter n=1 Tax=Torulaspora delbrueckii TaxID=4950 RepID=G8ZM03_TORDE|nr:hypothetical protein TDEL_0A03150 [Torulaspora delbrueckii]CCE89647.1 hypothetical protein TDEL_0A03150 [Torulaspora delbrueckii]